MLVRQGRKAVRRGRERTWPEIRAARWLSRQPGHADFSHEPPSPRLGLGLAKLGK